MSQERITVNYIASGQPRAYADSRQITRVQFERTPSMWSPAWPSEVKPEDIPWEPNYMNAKFAEDKLRRMGFLGTTPWKKDTKHGLDSYIEYIKPINPKKGGEVLKWGDPNEDVGDVWEFYIVQPFCD